MFSKTKYLFFLFLILLVAQTSAYDVLSNAMKVLAVYLLPVLLIILFIGFFYGLVNSMIDIFKKKNALMLLPMLVGFTDYLLSISSILFSLLMVFLMIVLPMALILILVKAMSKIIKS